MDLSMKAILRRFTKKTPGDHDVRLTTLESLATGLVELDLQELARAGRLFHGGTAILANGIAPVQALPTTTATLALYNGEDAGGLGYFVHRVNGFLASGTAAAGATLLACVSPAKIATPPTVMATGYVVGSSSGSTRGTKAKWTTAATLPTGQGGANPAWLGLQSTFQVAAANVGQGDGWIELKGGLCVPPGYVAGFAVLSGAGTTPLYGISAQWAEVETDLE